MRNKFLLIGLILIFAALVSGRDQSVLVDYSFSSDTPVERTVEFSSVLLIIKTDVEASCRYSSIEGQDYGEMGGVFSSTGKLHEKSFTGLGDGVYRYYVRCVEDIYNSSDSTELKITLVVNSLVTGQIVLSEEAPLKEGKVEVTLKTSKLVSQAPTLSYSFDGMVYSPVVLFGSGDVWEGYVIIAEELGEAVISFQFRGNDLEGREGNEIISGGVYFVDTSNPKTITDITAIGYLGKVELEWHLDDDVDEFNLYRSKNPNPEYTDFYKSVESESFEDVSVEKGKTYYYRVAGVDDAGNEGALSKEVSATVLLENGSASGLSIELRGKVDNLISEINSIISESDDIESSIPLKQEEEKNLFIDLKLDKELSGARAELESLKREVTNYKSQDLSKAELEGKLNSAELKLKIIKRKIPENLIIVVQDTDESSAEKGEIEEAILELNNDISEEDKEKSLEKTLKIIEDFDLKIRSKFSIIEIVHIDGTKNEISVVEREISGNLEDTENAFFVEIVPKDMAESASELDIKSLDYRVVKEDPVLSFNADTRKIIYTLNKKVTLNLMKESSLVFVKIHEGEAADSEITGYFLFMDKLKNRNYMGILVGVVILVGMFVYFVYLRKSNFSGGLMDVYRNVHSTSTSIKKGDLDQARESYGRVRESYVGLNEKEKKKVYRKVKSLRNKIIKKMKR